MQMLKPAAALSAGLLARKGQAKPALRPGINLGPPVPVEVEPRANVVDDRIDVRRIAVRDILSVEQPAVEIEEAPAPIDFSAALPVAREQDITPPQIDVSEPSLRAADFAVNTDAQLTRAPAGSKSKAAFTLRLDRERHLRLRLLCAHSHRSAQAVLIDALDAYLSSRPPLVAAGNCPCREGASA